MLFGLFSTFMSPLADREMIKSFANQAETIGIDSLWLGEHVVLFDEMEFPYPALPMARSRCLMVVACWILSQLLAF